MPNKKRTLASILQAPAELLSPVAGEIAAGASGIYGLLTGGADEAARRVDRTREKFRYEATDPRARRVVKGIRGLLEPLAVIDEGIRRPFKEIADPLSRLSPGAATAVSMVPDAALSFVGGRQAVLMAPEAKAGLSQMAQRTAQAPAMGSPVAQIGAINAWHGTPHDFDRFSMEHIGKGEGAQAYGHGLYFAGDRRVAQSYADNVKDMGAIDRANKRMSELARVMHKHAIPGAHRKYRDPEGDAAAAEYDRLMEEKMRPRGKVYDVELAPDEADLLDWDAPLAQQPEKVRAALAKLADDYGYQYGDHYSGRDLYHALTGDVNTLTNRGAAAAADASELLRHHGIPGIRYLDGMSRGAGEGSRNYVMFDDSLIKIRGKE